MLSSYFSNGEAIFQIVEKIISTVEFILQKTLVLRKGVVFSLLKRKEWKDKRI
jgi:hypothetical protein